MATTSQIKVGPDGSFELTVLRPGDRVLVWNAPFNRVLALRKGTVVEQSPRANRGPDSLTVRMDMEYLGGPEDDDFIEIFEDWSETQEARGEPSSLSQFIASGEHRLAFFDRGMLVHCER